MRSNLKKFVFTLIMVLGFGYVNVNAASDYYIYVNDTMLTSENNSITFGNGSISYNETTKELTLNNATINSTMDNELIGVISINNDENVTIKLVGNNIINNVGSSQGILSTSNLTITGTGNLNINTDGYGIYLGTGNLIIKDTTLNVTSSNWSSILVNDDLIIDNSLIDLKAPYDSGIYADTGTVTFKNLTGKAFQKSRNYPITFDTDICDNDDISIFSNGQYKLGYSYVKISNLYSVTTDNDSNSTIILSDTNVLDGQSITATIGTSDDYKIKSILVNNEESKNSLVDGKLTLTINKDTTIKVVSEEINIEVDAPEIEESAKIEEVTFGVDNDELEKKLKIDIKNQFLNFPLENTKVVIEVNNIDSEDILDYELETINEEANNNGYDEVVSYFDITVKVLKNNEEVGILSETSNKIKFQVALPDKFTEVKDGYTRTYTIIRYHNRIAEILDTKFEDNLLIFESDKFSTYAISYVDTANLVVIEPNPNTGDNIYFYIVISILSILGMTGVVIFSKKTN